ncbi:TetR/AcrR family transcriptional regulator [Streptomyces sp. J2-1]|nr:TetR/AcrR family transcriptional regulator [Streptomyces corallincola]
MEIARAAAALFVRQGLRATRAEDVARAAGVAPRTFYRYFATKEEAVAPLYAAGAQRWTEAVRVAPAHLTVAEALRHAVRHTLVPGIGISAASWEWVRALIQVGGESPALRKVWAEVCQTSEEALAEALAERLAAGARGEGAGEGAEGVSGAGMPGVGVSGAGDDNVSPGVSWAPPSVTPHLRFAAAVAGSAVRVAVESWAGGAAPHAADGPAALALRNLAALDGFDWAGRG